MERRRRVTRLRVAAAALAFGLVAVAALAIVAGVQWAGAQRQEHLAVSRQLAADAVAQLAVDPGLGLALAVEAVDVADTREAVAALRQALVTPRSLAQIPMSAVDLALDPTGRRVAVTGGDGDASAGIWDLDDGDLVHALPGHTDGALWVAFSPDGRYLATTDPESVSVWDAQDGALVRVLDHGPGTFPHMAWTPDSRHLLTVTFGDDLQALRRWAVDGGEPVSVVDLAMAASNLRVTSDGRTAVVWFAAASPIHVVDLVTGAVRHELAGHDGATVEVLVSSDGSRAVSVGLDGAARIWDLDSGMQVTSTQGMADRVFVAAWSPDGAAVLVADAAGTVRLVDAATGQVHVDERAHRGAVVDGAFSADGTVAATISVDGTAAVWDVTSGRVRDLLRVDGHASQSGVARTSIAFTPDGRVVTQGASTEVWEVPPGPDRTLSGDGEGPFDLTVAPDGTRLTSSMVGGTMDVWDLPSGDVLWTLEEPDSSIRASLSPDGTRVATAHRFHLRTTVQPMPPPAVWDVETGTELSRLPVPDSDACATGLCSTVTAQFRPDGRRLLTAGEDGVVRLWEADGDPALVSTLEPVDGWIDGTQWSPDGRLIAGLVTEARAVVLWDADTGEIVRDLPGLANGIAFSPDGAQLAVAREEFGVVDVVDVATGDVVAAFRHASRVVGVAWSPDGTFLLAASGDGAHLWDVPAQLRIQGFGAQGAAMSVAFGPDDAILFGANGTVHVHACHVCGTVDDLLAQARSGSLRELTELERARFLVTDA